MPMVPFLSVFHGWLCIEEADNNNNNRTFSPAF
jgi:hypothetical protein